MGQADHWIDRTGALPPPGLAPALDGTSSDPASATTPAEAVRPTPLRDQRNRTFALSTDPSPGREKNPEPFMPHTLTPPHDGLSMAG
ncbi:hypothetical protein Sliba_46280 [Streptomyces nigrescens]|uniref:Uncharacterized protein n=1 Tax=Streptomyces nigrescens TaxID=1920 RepID=A0A640TQ17_STRNI|nr:hypothetical protein Sliba_46280 [Streptomyces libani subsp. libani]GGW00095.1 hypothetical protein GCM10010500_52390 [Streptomyces libani subsp. libani]